MNDGTGIISSSPLGPAIHTNHYWTFLCMTTATTSEKLDNLAQDLTRLSDVLAQLITALYAFASSMSGVAQCTWCLGFRQWQCLPES